MNRAKHLSRSFIIVALAFAALATIHAQSPTQAPPPAAGEFKPTVGQPGKDVVWVPSPEATVEKMLDVAQVTAQDYVYDLGSGDGRNVIAAAKRGARAHGVEYNPDMVELSRRNAEKAGVATRATFTRGDMYEADFSQATVLALFLLPDNLNKLRTKFESLTPGTRIVVNTFGIDGWSAEQTVELTDNCSSWCSVLLYIVPAKVNGTWESDQGTLQLNQTAQAITGSLGTTSIENGRVRGDQVSFTAGGVQYVGRLTDGTLTGTLKSASKEGTWKATRASK
jgi:SAM-dependent methyltransferase